VKSPHLSQTFVTKEITLAHSIKDIWVQAKRRKNSGEYYTVGTSTIYAVCLKCYSHWIKKDDLG
jgi:hypothetical protein